jgi:prepilin-type N-terminal cleavage/methylation domain-containing protein
MKTRSVLRGFTLVELLVVIAILAILLVILIPALSGAMEKSRRPKCASNLKQIGSAYLQYAGDNKGRFPSPISSGKAPFESLGVTGNTAVARGPAVLFGLGLLESPDVMYCPAANRLTRQACWKVPDWGNSSSSFDIYAGYTNSAFGADKSYDAFVQTDQDNTKIFAMDHTEGHNDWSCHFVGRKCAGGNVMMGDTHVEWRPFTRMERRYAQSGREYYW